MNQWSCLLVLPNESDFWSCFSLFSCLHHSGHHEKGNKIMREKRGREKRVKKKEYEEREIISRKYEGRMIYIYIYRERDKDGQQINQPIVAITIGRNC